MKVSLVITFLNEESTIGLLLEGIAQQTLLPAEIILVDGGSIDSTKKIIKQWQKNPLIGKKIHVLRKKGNRSAGRNYGIQKAKHSWIAITDAGCVPESNWLLALVEEQQTSQADVIAGYYYGLPQNAFEQAVVPYALVTPSRVNPKTFLPATRSLMLHKSVWEKLDGFDETLSLNEDFAFANKMQHAHISRSFTFKALVGWIPRQNMQDFWEMIYSFALGDIQAGIMRPKVLLIFLRYAAVIVIFIWMAWLSALSDTSSFFISLLILYSLWAIRKNKKYVPRGWYWLPMLQVVSDLAVMTGTLQGLFERKRK
jgi:glycosyltransferase involved in cell wall biosynthesis